MRKLAPEARIGPHLHDTRGVGPANFYAALRMGLTCSTVRSQNSAAVRLQARPRRCRRQCVHRDIVFMAHEMGVATGIDHDALIDCALMAERIIGRPLGGRIMHSGSLSRFRPR
jgi:hydroxymethylglutaryl-CoA lyase